MTLTELLVVLMIIGLLSTIALPVYLNRAQQSRISTAAAECRQIGEAEEACAANHGFYVAIQVLDDVPGGTGDGLTFSKDDAIEFENQQYVIDPRRSVQRLDDAQPSIDVSSEDVRVRKMVREWAGPFLNPQRVYTGDSESAEPDNISGFIRRDWVLDPWGQPYRFYSPLGIIGSGANNTSPEAWNVDTFSNGLVTRTDPRFDRFVIVSYGPNGLSNSDTADDEDDDIFYSFGTVRSKKETDYASEPTANPTTVTNP